MANVGKAKPEVIKAGERRAVALELRKRGLTFRQIAQGVKKWAQDKRAEGFAVTLPKGYDERYAWMDVNAELKRLNKERTADAEEVRRLELERLDVAIAAIMPQVQRGNHGAIDRLIRLSKRRSELLGLDAPKSVDLTTGGEPLPAHTERIIVREVIREAETGEGGDGNG